MCVPNAKTRIRNGFWSLGPNLTGYPGGFPQGLLSRLKASPWWRDPVAHVCAGSLREGVTVDLKPETRPTVVADAHNLPFKDDSFATVVTDPPYSDHEAAELYGTPRLKPMRILAECGRVVRPGGHVILYHRNFYGGRYVPRWLELVGCVAVHHGRSGQAPLRSLQVWRKRARLTDFAGASA